MSYPTVGVDLDVPWRPSPRVGHPGLRSPPAKRLQDAGVGPRKLVPDDLHRLDARHLILNLKQGL